jgi:hypothetical protein
VTQKSRNCYQSIVRNGEPHSRAYYEAAVAQALKGAGPDDDFLDLCPFRGEEVSSLAEAVYRLAVDKLRGGAREKREVENV